MKDISPIDLFHRALRFWWVVAACAALGGLVGVLFASFHPAVYEAAALYRASFNQARAPDSEYLDIEATKQAALEIINSPEVRSQVAEQAEAEGVVFSSQDFDDGTFTVQRLADRWYLSVRNEEPQIAAMLANAWAAAALPPLEEAYSHAVAAESLEQQIAVQEQCFETADLKAANTCAGTDFGNRGEHAAALQGLRTELSSEERAARGIVAALMLEGVGEAAPPDKPIYYGRNTLVLAGIFLGFLVGAGLTLVLPLPSGTVR